MPEFVSKLGFWATDNSLTQWYLAAYRKIWSWTQFRLIMWNQALGLESTYSSSGKRFQRGSSVQRMCLAQTWFHLSCVRIVKFIYTVKKRKKKRFLWCIKYLLCESSFSGMGEKCESTSLANRPGFRGRGSCLKTWLMTKGQSYVDISPFRTRDQSHSFSTICTWALEIGENKLMMRHLSRAP